MGAVHCTWGFDEGRISDAHLYKSLSVLFQPGFGFLEGFGLAHVDQLQVIDDVRTDLRLGTDGKVELDDGEFAGPIFHVVEDAGRHDVNAAEGKALL